MLLHCIFILLHLSILPDMNQVCEKGLMLHLCDLVTEATEI